MEKEIKPPESFNSVVIWGNTQDLFKTYFQDEFLNNRVKKILVPSIEPNQDFAKVVDKLRN